MYVRSISLFHTHAHTYAVYKSACNQMQVEEVLTVVISRAESDPLFEDLAVYSHALLAIGTVAMFEGMHGRIVCMHLLVSVRVCVCVCSNIYRWTHITMCVCVCVFFS